MFKHLSMTRKLVLSYALLLLCVMLLTAAVIIPMQTRDLLTYLKRDLMDTAEILSKDPEVISGLTEGRFSETLTTRLDDIMAESSHSGYIVICDSDSIRLYHPDRAFVGERFGGGDDARLREGETAYTSQGPGTSTPQLRAFHAVNGEDGDLLGFVIASDSMDAVIAMQRGIFLRLVLICLAVFAVGFMLALVIAGNIRRILLGNDPPTFARMFLQREEILNHLSEGILAFDEEGNAVYKNTAGGVLFEETKLPQDHPLYADYTLCKDTGEVRSGLMAELGGRNCIVSAVPVVREGLFHIVMMILRDRTEIVRLTEQVDGTNHLVDALRANTHEYINKLHVISGLLQVGDTERAVKYIGSASDEIQNDYQTVVRQVQNRTVAALILGKMSHAKELNIQFDLRSDSVLPAENPHLSTQEMITIIGNLVENAFDAINGKPEPRQAELYIGCDANGINISVDDTGRGMDNDQIERIYSGRFTTKGAGHGYGLRLIQEIVHSHGGYLQIDAEPGNGAFISVVVGGERTQSGREEKT